jgi:hypothetical protein
MALPPGMPSDDEYAGSDAPSLLADLGRMMATAI